MRPKASFLLLFLRACLVYIISMNKTTFLKLATIFNNHGYRLYMVGGTTRDYLLDKDVLDYDFVTDATPDEMKTFLPDANYRFANFGTVRLKDEEIKVDIATMRVEGEYKDYRHPSYVKYVKTIKEDYVRRDFTINAIYIDEHFNIIDYVNGIDDLEHKVIRFIGDPVKRIKEDPLRILRAERFQKKLGFTIEEEAKKAMKKYHYLLDELNPQKVIEELHKLEDK